MNLRDYEQTGHSLYGEFAAIVKLILEQAISAAGLPRPQSVQYRAKATASLETKLGMQGQLDSESLESNIKDLAGVRIIFYTNTDVDRFVNSGLIRQEFAIDWREGRIHHPTTENAGQRYQAIHFIVSLDTPRIALAEYAKFQGLRCEIQVQTILNHAWAETSHDILYKARTAEGFGTKALQAIEKRFARIMDEYLLPAGYEMQKVQYDYQRLMEGKALFDRGTLEVLGQCKDNNERFETLSTIRVHVLPHYDDIKGIYGELYRPLVDSVSSAFHCAPTPIETPFGMLPGKTAEDVANLVLNIIDDLRYVDIERTFGCIRDLYHAHPSGKVREHLLQVTEHLAQYDINVWQHAGPHVQYVLAERVTSLHPDERQALRPVVIKIWRTLLSPQIQGTTHSSVNSFTIHSGSLPPSNALTRIREQAISGLLEAWDRSSTIGEEREAFSAVMEATRMPMHGNYSSELCATILNDSRRIISAVADRLARKPYDFLEHVERRLLYQYHRARTILEKEQDAFGCREIASSLIAVILPIRDALNADENYVRYKTLVGFETVLPPQWEDRAFDSAQAQVLRDQRATEYVSDISEENEDEWYGLIVGCAATESVDGGVFPVFSDFLGKLSKAKPTTMLRFLKREDPHLARFLVPILQGLSQSSVQDEYRVLVEELLSQGEHLWELGRHFQVVGSVTPAQAEGLLAKAVGTSNGPAVTQCLLLSIKLHDSQARPLVEKVFVPALHYLLEHNDTGWVIEASFINEGQAFFAALPAELANLVLECLLPLPRIDDGDERLLSFIAQMHPAAIWDFFARRLERDEHSEPHYEAFPLSFQYLQEPLARNADSAIAIVREWFRGDDPSFRFRGAMLLRTVFADFPGHFEARLRQMARNGSDEDLDFILEVTQNYHGGVAIHPLLQDIVDRTSEDDPRLSKAEISLRGTEGVVGEFGMVDALRRKKDEVAPWLNDSRPRVRAFAIEYVRSLDRSIAFEQRRAEQATELRQRNFEGDDPV
jgi:ppGpp synthetase/RelA/SpoT-type nucleotidyltranferase